MTNIDGRRDAPDPGDRPRWLLHPYKVILIAALLPGVGQVFNNMPVRGITMLFFTIILGWVSYYTTTPEHSYLGRYAGGLFIYSISILDAYRWARYRWEHFGGGKGSPDQSRPASGD